MSRTEECVDILKLAWSGERFSYARQALPVRRRAGHARPRAARRPAAVDGGVERPERRPGRALRHQRAARRARCRCSTRWREKLAAAGGDPAAKRVGIIRSFLVTDDPERDWPPLRAAERYRMAVYGRFFEEAGLGNSGHVQRARADQPAGVRRQRRRVRRRADRVRPALRPHRRRHVGLGARPAAGRADAVDGALRRRGRAAGARPTWRPPPADHSSSGVVRGPKMNSPSGTAGSGGSQAIASDLLGAAPAEADAGDLERRVVATRVGRGRRRPWWSGARRRGRT